MKREPTGCNQSARDERWLAQLGALEAFKKREGHCNVPAHSSRSRVLGRWLNKQRARRKAGLLSPARVAQLDALGVVWDMLSAQWEERFAALARYKALTGDCEVPRGYSPDPQLATWLRVQRREKRAGKLSKERFTQLEALGVVWESRTTAWEQRFTSLAAYKAKNGNCEVPRVYPSDPALPIWITHQRVAKRKGVLAPERVSRLEALGLRWEPREDEEESIFHHLVQFHSQFGHCNIPATHPVLGAVGNWLIAQRMAKRKGTLSEERRAKLESLGVSWDPHADAWEERCEALCAFKARKGNCDIPTSYRQDIGLYAWLIKQRTDFRRGVLSDERRDRLEQLGVELETSTEESPSKHRKKDGTRAPSWNAMLQQLKDFKLTQGHCNVPVTYSENRALGMWLARQRESWRQGKLAATRVAQLEAMGVEWDPLLANEEEFFAKLEDYKRDSGHCNVPESHATLQRLGEWLTRKRMAKRRGTLDKSTVARLESLGIEWDPREAAWETQYARMRTFIEEKGHSDVPQNNPEYTALAGWAAGQRTRRREGTLEAERVERLDRLGFSWNPAEENLESIFAELEAFRRREGHCNVPYDYPACPGLGAWLSAQRSARKRGTLSADRLARLESLGVVWNPRWEGAIRITGFQAKLCKLCGEPFVPTHGSAKHCSPECYMEDSTVCDERTGCKLWKGGLDSEGRPHAHWAGKRRKAHIMAFELSGGVLPEGKLLRHLCNTPRCCNPDHLKVGTHAENMADKAASGVAAGEKSYNSLLTNQQACEIYAAKGGGSAAAVAAQFCVPRNLVRRIWNGESYARITGAARASGGRPRGDTNHASRCSNETAVLIYEEKKKEVLTAAATARKYGVSDPMVRNIWSGRTHSGITGAKKCDRKRKRKCQTCIVCGQQIGIVVGRRKFCSWQCALSARIRIGSQAECWPWAGERPAGGYGQITFCGKRAMAHIVAFDLANPALAARRLEEGLTISHSCHNTLCCNPAHLRLATIRENAASNRGRLDISGESNPQAKIDSMTAGAIKRLIATGMENRAIRDQIKAECGVDVPPMVVADIRRGRTWRHLPQE